MKKRLNWKLIRSESGVSLVLVALAMVVLLGFTALVIDGGRLYLEKSKLQKAMDAAVLAGAQELRTSGIDPKSVAIYVAQKNGYSLTDGDLTVDKTSIDGEYSIEGKKMVNVPMTFARVIGVTDVDVSAKAKAIVSPLKSASVVPIAIDKTVYDIASKNGEEVQLNFGKGEGQSGNFGYLDLNGGGGGAQEIINIINGGGETVTIGPIDPGDMVDTKTGSMFNPITSALQPLIDNDPDHCTSPDSITNSCTRVIKIVIIDTWTDANGNSRLEVVGLAAFWIDEINKNDHTITGYYIKDVSSGEIGSGSEIGEYNLYGVKLVE